MAISDKKLSLDGNAELLEQLTGDFYVLAKNEAEKVPSRRVYQINCDDEPNVVKRAARSSVFKKLNTPMEKVAFDTRRVDQNEYRNPRHNLQNWHRSDEFVDANLQARLNTFARLNNVLEDIEAAYGGDPEYLHSYAKELNNHVRRGLRMDTNDGDYFLPQLDYLEQLLYTRYRVAMSDINSMEKESLKKALLVKDENLLKRGALPKKVKRNDDESPIDKMSANIQAAQLAAIGNQMAAAQNQGASPVIVTGQPGNITINNGSGDNKQSQENIINALFGGGNLKKGDKSVSRTVTITITDEVD